MDTTRCSRVVRPAGPSMTTVALSRPMRREAPPARMTAANGSGDVTYVTLAQHDGQMPEDRSVDRPGVLTAQQRLQRGGVVRTGLARSVDLLACRIVVGRLADL